MPVAARQAPALRITSPAPDAVVSGSDAARGGGRRRAGRDVQTVTFFVDGRLVCTAERPPFGCTWDPGAVVRGHHVRVVATLADGRRLIDNVRTKDLGYHRAGPRRRRAGAGRSSPSDGKFVRGLKKQDFELFEDGVAQPVASLVSEDAPLDLVLASTSAAAWSTRCPT